MLAHAPGVAYTGFLVVFGVIGIIPVAVLRATKGSPGPGLVTLLFIGLPAIQGSTLWPAHMLYREVALLRYFCELQLLLCLSLLKSGMLQLIVYILAGGCLAAAAMFLVGSFVLPTLAGDEMRASLAASIRGCGIMLSA